jgi:hypothetical protein
MKKEANAIIVLSRTRPFNLGHVGWGYEYPDGTWCVGAIEAELFQNFPNGFWKRRAKNLEEGINYFRKMEARFDANYDEFKYLRADSSPNWKAADDKMFWVEQQPYNIAGRNCMNSTYDILCAFSSGGHYNGSFLPRPEDNWIPNMWYDKIIASSRHTI